MSDYIPKRLIIYPKDIILLTGLSGTRARETYNWMLEILGKQTSSRKTHNEKGQITYIRGQHLTVFEYAQVEGISVEHVCKVLKI